MRTIHVNITGMFVQKDCKNGGVQGEGNATQLHITFDETWKGYGKRVIWRNAQGENPVAVVLIAAAAAGTANTLTYDTPIPAEALALPGWCSFTVEGFQDAETASAMFSVRDVLQVMENDGANSPAKPTPSESQLILDAIAKNEEAVGAYAKESKSWAVGGTESREGEDTDNAMYYAQQAEASRKDASESAKSASVSAGSAAASAAAAAGSKAAADKSAGVAKDSAILSQSWAVGDTGTREGENTDNARYWAQQAHAAAGGGVVSFNGRTGSVIPKKGDYTAADVGALPKSTDVVLNTRAATYYVSPNGSDDNDGSEAKPFKTINKAISKVGNFVAGTVQIILERGTYDERVVIASKGGHGQIEIRARDAVNGSNEWIDTGVSVKSFYCIETKCKITLRGIDVYGVDNIESNCSVYVSSCTFMHLDNLRIQSATSSGNIGAVTISWGGELFFWHTDISNKHCALLVTGATAYMSNRITGSNNNIAIQCGSGQGTLGGIVFKGGSPIEGSEVTAFGGQIFD